MLLIFIKILTKLEPTEHQKLAFNTKTVNPFNKCPFKLFMNWLNDLVNSINLELLLTKKRKIKDGLFTLLSAHVSCCEQIPRGCSTFLVQRQNCPSNTTSTTTTNNNNNYNYNTSLYNHNHNNNNNFFYNNSNNKN